MALGNCNLVLDLKREDGEIELVFSHLHWGFKGYLITITKALDGMLEDEDFRSGAKTIRSWWLRLFHGIDELFPVFGIEDTSGNTMRFYRGRDRKGRERLYSCSYPGRRGAEEGGAMLVAPEAYATILAQLDAIPEFQRR